MRLLGKEMSRTTLVTESLRAAAALGLAFFLVQFPFLGPESFLIDLRQKLFPNRVTSGQIETIAIDRESLAEMKREPDIVDHLQLLDSVLEDKPKAVVYLLNPERIKAEGNELQSWIRRAESADNLYFAVDDIFVEGQEERILLRRPFHGLMAISAPLTSDKQNFALDGKTRRAILSYNGRLILHSQLAQMYGGFLKPQEYRGAFEFRGSQQVLLHFRPKGFYQSLSFSTVAERRFPKGTFSGKIVVIGTDTKVDASDYVKTSLDDSESVTSKLELTANILDNLMLNSGLVRPNETITFLLTGLLMIATVLLLWHLPPLTAILGVLGLGLGTLVFSFLVFAASGVAIPTFHPLLGLFICYYFFIPYRLIKESRASWEFQQKHKVLTQVEELKTNFLSMMSHDLRTPLARIQGMTEVAMGDSHSLSSQQKEAIQTISRSAEELKIFINSILNLTRLESNEVELHLQSKDVNTLLEEVLRQYDFMAKQKKIEIRTELEPLFSIKMDVDLMRQVFANLIENAIKYSPEGSRILISTEETDGRITVQIADQGIGIPAEEQPNVFSKFYRSPGVKNSAVKGSGLGLYLAKYFVELHHGRIAVESEPQKGSTFSVQLPMQ